MNVSIRAAIATIGEGAWTPIKYPQAIWDEDDQRWVSDAHVAVVPYVAFTSRKKVDRVPGRLIVRRLKGSTRRLFLLVRVSCSASGVTTSSSPTWLGRCWRWRPLTMTTPSSSK